MANAQSSNLCLSEGSTPSFPTTIYLIGHYNNSRTNYYYFGTSLDLTATTLRDLMLDDFEDNKFDLLINRSKRVTWKNCWFIHVKGLNGTFPSSDEDAAAWIAQEAVRSLVYDKISSMEGAR